MEPEPQQAEIVKDETAGRYEARLGDRVVGVADFRPIGDVVVMPHTEVDPSMRGTGVAGRLVRFALDDIRAQGLRVDPQCSYVAEYLDRHPEYADLRRA